jgi:hypothetical protein
MLFFTLHVVHGQFGIRHGHAERLVACSLPNLLIAILDRILLVFGKWMIPCREHKVWSSLKDREFLGTVGNDGDDLVSIDQLLSFEAWRVSIQQT